MDKNEASKKFGKDVIDSLGTTAFIFGGFVRDHIAGIPFRDVDIKAGSRSSREAMFNRLKAKGYRVMPKRTSSKYNFVGHKKETFTVSTSTGYEWDVDVLIPGAQYDSYGEMLTEAAGVEDSPINESTIDVDVNALKMDSNGVIAPLLPSVDLTGAMARAHRKMFRVINRDVFNSVAFGGLTRKDKLTQKGFSEEEEKGKKMSNNGTAMGKTLEMFKKGAENGAQLALATQSTKLAKKGLLTLAEKKGADSATIMMVSAALDTEAGTALIHMLLSMALLHAPIPQVQNSEKAQKMAQFFMDKGMETGMVTVSDAMLEAFGPALLEIVGLTSNQQFRVAEEHTAPAIAAAPVRMPLQHDLTEEEIEAAMAAREQKKKAALPQE